MLISYIREKGKRVMKFDKLCNYIINYKIFELKTYAFNFITDASFGFSLQLIWLEPLFKPNPTFYIAFYMTNAKKTYFSLICL